MATRDLYPVVAAEDAFELVAAVIGRFGGCEWLVFAVTEKLDGDAIDARLADLGHSVIVGVKPDQVAKAVDGLRCATLVCLGERGSSAVIDVDALYLSTVVGIARVEYCRTFVGVRSPRGGGCDPRSDGVVNRALRLERWNLHNAVNDWRCNRFGARPPLDALAAWGAVTPAGIYAHDSREGEDVSGFD